MPRKEVIESLLDKATFHYFKLSEIHKKLLKYGYNKPFSIFLEDVGARVTYRKILSG